MLPNLQLLLLERAKLGQSLRHENLLVFWYDHVNFYSVEEHSLSPNPVKLKDQVAPLHHPSFLKEGLDSAEAAFQLYLSNSGYTEVLLENLLKPMFLKFADPPSGDALF